MPNPAGQNQFRGREPAYGAKKNLSTLTRSAPLSGAPVPDAAKQAQRRAVKASQGGGRQVVPSTAPPPPVQPTYYAQIAAIYQELAAQTNDPTVQEYAARAQAQARQQ